MSNFYIGQEVVALTDAEDIYAQPRTKGRIYRVQDIMYCPKTGMQMINTGYKQSVQTGSFDCASCGGTHANNGLAWTRRIHYTPLQTKSEESDMEESIKEALEKPLFV